VAPGDLFIVERITRPGMPGVLFGPNNRQLTRTEVSNLVSCYWPGQELENALRISWCESGWWTGSWNYIGEDSRGIWQINCDAHSDWLWWNLFDPQVCCYWAHQLWSQQGWRPWSCARKLGIVT
jgi:hypothetical protein